MVGKFGDILGLAYIPGFHLGLIVIDPMHVLHLGVLLWAIGNLLVSCVAKGFFVLLVLLLVLGIVSIIIIISCLI